MPERKPQKTPELIPLDQIKPRSNTGGIEIIDEEKQSDYEAQIKKNLRSMSPEERAGVLDFAIQDHEKHIEEYKKIIVELTQLANSEQTSEIIKLIASKTREKTRIETELRKDVIIITSAN